MGDVVEWPLAARVARLDAHVRGARRLEQVVVVPQDGAGVVAVARLLLLPGFGWEVGWGQAGQRLRVDGMVLVALDEV